MKDASPKLKQGSTCPASALSVIFDFHQLALLECVTPSPSGSRRFRSNENSPSVPACVSWAEIASVHLAGAFQALVGRNWFPYFGPFAFGFCPKARFQEVDSVLRRCVSDNYLKTLEKCKAGGSLFFFICKPTLIMSIRHFQKSGFLLRSLLRGKRHEGKWKSELIFLSNCVIRNFVKDKDSAEIKLKKNIAFLYPSFLYQPSCHFKYLLCQFSNHSFFA